MDAPEQKATVPFDPRNERWRLRLLAGVFVIGFLAVLVRLFMVQVIHGGEYRERARRQYEARVELRPQRGIIYDRTGREIAKTIQSASYAADPQTIEQKEIVCELLSNITGADRTSLLKKITDNPTRRFVWLVRGVPTHQTAAIDSLHIKGLIRVTEPKRNYVYGAMASQVIGCTDVDNKGLAGIELAYDSLLRGKNGYQIMQRDGKGRIRPAMNNSGTPVTNGVAVQLTIDAEVQGIVEYELQKGIQDAQAVSGTAIAIQPHTGEIVAIASYPTFNPNNLSVASADQMRLRAITDMYEPGSTFKLITTAVALENKLTTPESVVDGMNGEMALHDGTIVRDHEPIGTCTLTEALEKSSNIVFGNLARSIPSDVFYRTTRDFGFGIPLGFDIAGEVRGLLKKPKEFDNTTKLFMGYGYELAATALQVANAYATVANNGVMMKPYIVKAVLDENGHALQEFEPQKIRTVISPQTAQTLGKMFTLVVEHGTGTNARVQGITIAGKTGTAQQLVDGKYSKQAYTASFVGYFPVENPQLVILVMLDKPQTDIYGGRTAAPIFRKIVQRIVMSPGLASSMPALAELGNTIVHSDTVTVPDIRGLEKEAATTMLHESGLRIKADKNNGMVIQQSMKPGGHVQRGTEIIVQLRANANDSTASKERTLPDVRGFTLRRAIAVLHSSNFAVRVQGSGKVVRQTWSKKGKQTECLLECED